MPLKLLADELGTRIATNRCMGRNDAAFFRGATMPTAAIEVTTMKAAVASAPGEDFQIVEREIPEPGAGEVRIKVQACGVCHSDALIKEGSWPGISYPRVPEPRPLSSLAK